MNESQFSQARKRIKVREDFDSEYLMKPNNNV